MCFLCAVSETEVAGELEKGKCTLRQISEPFTDVQHLHSVAYVARVVLYSEVSVCG